MATSTDPARCWDPAGASHAAIPWPQVERTLLLCQRWPQPHLLGGRAAANPRRAAVAVLLWGDPEGAREVVLVQRGASAPQHGGELAFPGGMEEPFDRDLPATARRELAEELGVTGPLWEMGCFPDAVARYQTRFTPVFLRWEAPEPAFAVGSEIQAVLRLPVDGLLHAPWGTQVLDYQGHALAVPRLELAQAPLWGATARVLKTWLDLLASVRNL